jgi:hypothetical protein
MKQKIHFTDLDFALKICIIGGAISVIAYCVGFIYGFFGVA